MVGTHIGREMAETCRCAHQPMYDRDGQITEHGIDPDYFVSLTDEDFARGRDTIIEEARKLLKNEN